MKSYFFLGFMIKANFLGNHFTLCYGFFNGGTVKYYWKSSKFYNFHQKLFQFGKTAISQNYNRLPRLLPIARDILGWNRAKPLKLVCRSLGWRCRGPRPERLRRKRPERPPGWSSRGRIGRCRRWRVRCQASRSFYL